MAPYYGAIQCSTDQAISSDYYIDFSKYEGRKIPMEDMIEWFIEQWSRGVKTAYYHNFKEGTKDAIDALDESECTGCKL